MHMHIVSNMQLSGHSLTRAQDKHCCSQPTTDQQHYEISWPNNTVGNGVMDRLCSKPTTSVHELSSQQRMEEPANKICCCMLTQGTHAGASALTAPQPEILCLGMQDAMSILMQLGALRTCRMPCIHTKGSGPPSAVIATAALGAIGKPS